MSAPLSLGIDIGGTFTDLVIHDPRDGRAIIWKESTTPDDPARGALEGTRRVLEKAGVRPDQVGRVVHATTVAAPMFPGVPVWACQDEGGV